MTPRLAVTIDQAGDIIDGYHVLGKEAATLRLPERPTMPCPDTLHVHRVPIPEGTRVEVGWWESTAAVGGARSRAWDPVGYWHPVAFATLTEVHAALADGQPYRWYITLSDIKPVEG